jgi:predicted MFS family arabinose efflux permease
VLPRETPGFLVFVTSAALAALPITRVGLVAMLIFSAGMVGMAMLGDYLGLMIVMMIIGSTGMHLLQPVSSSVALGLSDVKSRGKRMGQMGMIDTLGVVVGTGFVWLFFDKAAPQYRTAFLCAAVLGCVGAVFYLFMHVPHLHKPRARMVLKRKYRLYYLLELFFGARKQIFITFGPWVLIRVYGQPAKSMGGLLMIAALIGIVFKPLAGMLIDYVGERTIMILDGLVLVFVCIGYGYAVQLTGSPDHARILACSCFIADNLLFALGSCRAIYLSRIADSPQEINSTLAMGVSINHVVSMTIPAVAGAIWAGFGYERVFLCAAVLALILAVLSTFVPGKSAQNLTPVAGQL